MTEKERIEKFKEFVGDNLSEKGIQWLIDNGFFITPASTKYHLNYEGGLYEHSMNVTKALLDLTDKNELKWERKESPFIVGLLHDVCKIDQYIYDKEKKQYVWNEKQLMIGHGDKSVDYIEKNIIKLTNEEKECILNHMGAFTIDKAKWTDYTDGIKKYQNVLWTHTADLIATHLIEQ